jgi:predicted esterase
VFVYHDYVYDDYGSRVGDPGAANPGTLSGTNGKVRYTADINSADLVALRLWIDGGQLRVQFELNTLRDANSTVAALAIDTDDNTATGGGNWADLAAVEQPHGSGTLAVPLSSTGWDQLHLFETGDPATNKIEGAIPLPPGTVWRVQAATGIKSRRVVMNVAFRNEDHLTTLSTSGLWFEERQADALALGDISQFGVVVDVSKLLGDATEPAPVAAGYHERVYVSDVTVAPGPAGTFLYDQDAEGMDYVGIPAGAGTFDQSIKFYGRNQPYGIYIPQAPNPPGPFGLQLSMHGLGANHASLINRAGMQQNVGEALNRIVAVPLGRGPAGWYDEASERDVLDVISDVTANYDVDTDQIFAGGYSMGGYGTYRLASLYPDRFAGFIVWVGAHEGRSAKGISAFDFLGNLRNVPGAMLYAGEDELVNITVYQDLQPRLAELAYENILYFHPAAEHLSFALAQDWRKEAAWSAGRTLQKQPGRVTYRTEPFTWNPEVGVIHDKAYWVSEIRARTTARGDYADVDVRAADCGSIPTTERTAPDPVGSDPVPWTAQEFLTTALATLGGPPDIQATLANVASLVIDTSQFTGACIAGETIDYEVTTDGPAEVSFSDGTTLDFAAAGTYTGTLPEPGAAVSLAAGAAFLAALGRVRRRR